MGGFWGFIGQYWWLVFVFGGTIAGGMRGVAAWNERRAERSMERYRIKHETKQAIALAKRQEADTGIERSEALTRVIQHHDAVDARWFDYEIDALKLLEFPMMTDMRDPLTQGFHKAKMNADMLRPLDPDEGIDAATLAQYREAVAQYAAAFDTAESEAIRRRDHDYSAADRKRFDRSRDLLTLAINPGSSEGERQSAYERAKREMQGLVNLPPRESRD